MEEFEMSEYEMMPIKKICEIRDYLRPINEPVYFEHLQLTEISD